MLPDVNVLVYVVNEDAALHERVAGWWGGLLAAGTPIALTDMTLLGFLRISTHPRLLPRPLTAEQALDQVAEWTAMVQARLVRPTARHWDLVDSLLRRAGVAGNLTTDAHLAALSIEHGVTIASGDTDFARFHGIRWLNPMI